MQLVDWFFEYIDIYDNRMNVKVGVTRNHAFLAGFLACYFSLFVTALLLLSAIWIFDNSFSPAIMFALPVQKALLVLSAIWGAFGFFSGHGKH